MYNEFENDTFKIAVIYLPGANKLIFAVKIFFLSVNGFASHFTFTKN